MTTFTTITTTFRKNASSFSAKRFIHRSSPRQAILMPAVSPFMTEGSITRWIKKEGESFQPGDTLCQIESDIAIIDVQAETPGILGRILIPAGARNVQVAQAIALVANSQRKTSQEPPSAMPSILSVLQAAPLSMTFSSESDSAGQSPLSPVSVLPMETHTNLSEPTDDMSVQIISNQCDEFVSPHSSLDASVPSLSSLGAFTLSSDGLEVRRKIVSTLLEESRFESRGYDATEYFHGLL